MSLPDLPFLETMSEPDRIHFRNLALLRPQTPSEGQLTLIEGLARTLAHPRLLTLIARTHHWLMYGPILQALAQNEATPEAIRRDLELAISIIDLMHGMDRAPVDEKEERAQTVKDVYAQLQPELKPIVKFQLKQLARQVNPTGSTQELPPIPQEVEDWDALTEPPEAPDEPAPMVELPLAERCARAESTHVPDELLAYLLDPELTIRHAALHNPVLDEEVLVQALGRSEQADLFDEVYQEARWYFREPIRMALYEAPACPEGLAQKLRKAWDLLGALDQSLSGPPNIRRIAALFTQLDETEYQYITLWAKRHAPALLRVVKIFYDRLQRRRSNQASGLAGRSGDGRWASLEERVFMANQSNQPDQLIAALRDPDPQVFTVVLENPVLTPREVLAAIPSLERTRLERLAVHPTWGEQAVVREALLHHPQLPIHTALRLVPTLTAPRALLDVLRDTRIPHVEVKERVLDMLRALYQGMSTQERILLIRSSGGELIRHLAQDVLKDEDTLGQLMSDRQLDPSILLRLARNKQTPRSILQQIAAHPILMAHPAIMSELLLNPKTPRDSAIRIWGLLSETEQQQLLRSPHLPAALRYLAN